MKEDPENGQTDSETVGSTHPEPPPEAEQRASRLILAVVLLAGLALSLPLLSGELTLYERDVFSIHLHSKLFGAKQLAEGSVPYFRPDWGLGQNYRSNPNLLPLYPGNAFYLVLPFWTAFNLHYVLHWFIALFSMRALARALGHTDLASLLAGITYAASGVLLSSLTFYNLLTVAAWWPLVMAGVIHRGLRHLVIAGVACGLAIYGGEPFTLLIGVLPLLVIAAQKHGLFRGVARSASAGAIGLLLAAPQIIAVLRTVSFTTRRTLGASDTNLFVVHPMRLLEYLAPFPFGTSSELGAERYLLGRLGEQEPFFYSLHVGLVALPLALVALRKRPILAVLTALGLTLAIVGGSLESFLTVVSLGLFRFPEKFLYLPTLLLPLLAAAGLDQEERLARTRLWAWGMAFMAMAVMPLAFFRGAAITQWLATDLLPVEVERIGETRALAAFGALGLSAAILLAAGLLAGKKNRVGLVALQLLAVARLLTLVHTDGTETYRAAPDWRARLPADARVVSSTYAPLFGETPSLYFSEITNKTLFLHVAHQDLDFQTGGFFDLEYPMVPDFEGLASPFQLLVLQNLPRVPWASRLNWLRTFGVDALVNLDRQPSPGLETIASTDRFGVATQMHRVQGPAPMLWWPETTTPNESPLKAFEIVSRSQDPVTHATVSGTPPAQGRGRGKVVEVGPDRVVLDVESTGGVIALRRAYHPLWRAQSDTADPLIHALNLYLVGIEVPPGSHRVVLSVDKRPDRAATGVAVLTLIACLVVVIRGGKWEPAG